MNEIRSIILDTTYDRCLKLLEPKSSEFKKHFGKVDSKSVLDDEERVVVSGLPRILQYVQMGGIELKEIRGVTRIPAIYIANGTESHEIPQESGLARLLGIELPFVGELYPVVIRLVIHQGTEPRYEDSNPVIIARIHEQLSYFLDQTNFRGLSADRVGYQFPSVVLRAGITASYNLEAIATPWEVYDFRFEVIFKRQKTMFDEYE